MFCYQKPTKEHAPNLSRPTSGPQDKRSFLPDHTPDVHFRNETSPQLLAIQAQKDKLPPLSPPFVYNTANYSCGIFTKLKYVP